MRGRYGILKSLAALLFSLLVLSALVFLIARLAPGDPLVSYYGDRTEKMTAEERARATERLGLNDALPAQYARWLGNALQGDFGISYKYKQPVTQVIGDRVANTLLLSGIGFVLTFGLALLLGVFCARQEDRWPDRLIRQIGTVTSCLPEFWVSLVLIMVFSVTLRWLPSSGAYSVGAANALLDRIRHLVLPMAVLVLSHLWYYAYMIRNMLLEEVRADYVLLAKSKGVSNRGVLFRHCLRNIMPAYISLMAISVPHILGGTYIIEMVFSYPGIGTLAYESARYHDYNLLMVLSMLTGALVMLGNMLGRAVNERIDPRLRIEERVSEVRGDE